MDYKREDIETLRLIKAFAKIADPEKRKEIVALTEKYACAQASGADNDRSRC
jgi:hypothetical protein